MDVREVQPLKAPWPMEVTLSGIIMDSKFEQSINTSSPILVRVPGSVIETKEEQPRKAPWAIEVTPFGMDIDSKFEQL